MTKPTTRSVKSISILPRAALEAVIGGAREAGSGMATGIVSPRDSASGLPTGVVVPHDIMHGGPTG